MPVLVNVEHVAENSFDLSSVLSPDPEVDSEPIYDFMHEVDELTMVITALETKFDLAD